MDLTQTQLLRRWTSTRAEKAKENASETVYSHGEKLSLTKPKRNADFRAKPKGLSIFMKSLNLMDLAL